MRFRGNDPMDIWPYIIIILVLSSVVFSLIIYQTMTLNQIKEICREKGFSNYDESEEECYSSKKYMKMNIKCGGFPPTCYELKEVKG